MDVNLEEINGIGAASVETRSGTVALAICPPSGGSGDGWGWIK